MEDTMNYQEERDMIDAQLQVLCTRLDQVGIQGVIVEISSDGNGDYVMSHIEVPGVDRGRLLEVLETPVPILPSKSGLGGGFTFSEPFPKLILEHAIRRVATNVARCTATHHPDMDAGEIEVSIANSLAKVRIDGVMVKFDKMPEDVSTKEESPEF
jgi:hypothetical protein